MMEVTHLTLVNWHAFVKEDIPITGHTAIVGGNATGKSTILDMMQVVLTGASGRYMKLNSVAGQEGKGSKRTVREYCLGALDEDQFRRDACYTYIAIGFRDTTGVRKPITIGLAFEARKTQPQEVVLGRFIIRGRSLTTTDFLRATDEGKERFADWEEVRASLTKEFGNDFVNHRERATEYVREYMRELVPNLAPNQTNAAALTKAIVNGMMLNQTLSATDFVREYIIEDTRLNIGDLRESLKTYRQVHQTIQDMENRAARLRIIIDRSREFQAAIMTKDQEDWLSKKAKYLAASCATRALELEITEAMVHVSAEDEEITELNENKREAQGDITRLRNQISAFKARTSSDDLQRTAETHQSTRLTWENVLTERVQTLQVSSRIAHEIQDSTETAGFITMSDMMTAAVQDKDFDKLRAADKLVEVNLPRIEAIIDEARSEADRLLHEHTESAKKLRSMLGQQRSGMPDAHLGEDTRALMKLLRDDGMNPRALCDIVDIDKAEWRQAAEGLLGKDREAIFVDRADIGSATEIMKRNRRSLRRASLVSLNKLEQYKGPANPGTFPTLFVSDDNDALAFLQRRYGNVRLARDMAEFNAPGRALMADGLYDDGLVRGTRLEDDHRLMIGKAAQAQLVVEWKQRLDEALENIETLGRQRRMLSHAMSSIHTYMGTGDTMEDVFWLIEKFRGLADEALARLSAIDLSEIEPLEQKLKAQEAYVSKMDEKLHAILLRIGGYKTAIETAKKRLDGISNAMKEGSRSARDHAKRVYRSFRKQGNHVEGNRTYRGRLKQTDRVEPPSAYCNQMASAHSAISDDAAERTVRATTLATELTNKVRRAMSDYFTVAPLNSQVGIDSSITGEILPWAEILLKDIEENELTRHREMAEEASEKVATMFRGEFVNALNDKVSKMDRALQSLNHSLRSHTFHGEKYQFRKTQVAQFAPILKAVEIYMTSEDALELLFKGDIPDDNPNKHVLDEVKRILEDPETKFDDFDDYRKFFVFEIHMENIETGIKSRWETRRGKGSGAEQQVPLYVALGASLAAVYGTSGENPFAKSGIAPAMFDEVFTKLDAQNKRQMMDFYNELGLQVIVAAPLDKKADLLGHMHTLVEVDKVGNNRSTTGVMSLKERARTELLAINPAFIGDDELREMAAAAE